MFNTKSWTWRYKPDKLARILHQLKEIEAGVKQEYQQMESIAGKLIDIRFLVKGGKFNMLFILIAANQELRPFDKITPNEMLRKQAGWWIQALQEADKNSPIIHPEPHIPSHALEGWSDAAGGSTNHIGAGLGGVVPPNKYFYLPWPAWLNKRKCNSDNVAFADKLTCLELLGPLVLLATCGTMAARGHF